MYYPPDNGLPPELNALLADPNSQPQQPAQAGTGIDTAMLLKLLGASGGGANPAMPYAAIGNLGAGLVEQTEWGSETMGGNMTSNAMRGASMGAAFGPAGMAIGAAAGAGYGAYNYVEEKNAETIARNVQTDQKMAGLSRNKELRSDALLNLFPTKGVDGPGYYKKGGKVYRRGGKVDYLVEDGEVMEADPSNPPLAVANGKTKKIGANSFKFEGDSHEDPSNGISVQGGNTPYVNELDAGDGGFVYSNDLTTSSKRFLKYLK